MMSKNLTFPILVLVLYAGILVSIPFAGYAATVSSISANPTSITEGGSSTLTAQSPDTRPNCWIDGTDGSRTFFYRDLNTTITPSETTTYYVVECQGTQAGEVFGSIELCQAIEGIPGSSCPKATVTVTQASVSVTASLTADNSTVSSGQSTTLRWSSTDATSCSGTNFSTGGATSGSVSISPTTDTTYTVTCSAPASGGGVWNNGTLKGTTCPDDTYSGQSFDGKYTGACSPVGDTHLYKVYRGENTSCSGYNSTGGETYTYPTYNVYKQTCVEGSASTVSASETVYIQSGTISATPNPCTIESGSYCTSSISWSSTNAPDAAVWLVNQTTGNGSWFSKVWVGVKDFIYVTEGNYTFRLYSRETTSSTVLDSVVVTGVKPDPTANLFTNPGDDTIVYGESTTLRWTSTDASSCTGSGPGFSTGGATSGSDAVAPTKTTEYSINCDGALDSQTIFVTIPDVTLTASDTNIDEGDSTTISWTSSNTTSCNPDFSNKTGTSGSVSVSPTQNTTYNITCSSDGDNVSDSILVNVTPTPAPTVTLSASPTNITEGGTSTLSWSSANTSSCYIHDPVKGIFYTGLTTSGSMSVSPENSTTYTLNCNDATDTAQVTVTAQPSAQITTFYADPSSIELGQSTNVFWDSSNTDSCELVATGGLNQTWSGLVPQGQGSITPTSAQTVSLEMTCENASSEDIATDTVTVSEPVPEPTANLTAESPIIKGQSSTLLWSSTNASSCTGTNFSTGGATSGTVEVSPTVDTRYTVSCTGSGGNASDSENVIIRDPQVSITASPQRVLVGRTSEVEWSATDVDSCIVYGPNNTVFEGTREANANGILSTTNKDTSVIREEEADTTRTYIIRCTVAGEEGAIEKSSSVTITPIIPEFEEI